MKKTTGHIPVSVEKRAVKGTINHRRRTPSASALAKTKELHPLVERVKAHAKVIKTTLGALITLTVMVLLNFGCSNPVEYSPPKTKITISIGKPETSSNEPSQPQVNYLSTDINVREEDISGETNTKIIAGDRDVYERYGMFIYYPPTGDIDANEFTTQKKIGISAEFGDSLLPVKIIQDDTERNQYVKIFTHELIAEKALVINQERTIRLTTTHVIKTYIDTSSIHIPEDTTATAVICWVYENGERKFGYLFPFAIDKPNEYRETIRIMQDGKELLFTIRTLKDENGEFNLYVYRTTLLEPGIITNE